MRPRKGSRFHSASRSWLTTTEEEKSAGRRASGRQTNIRSYGDKKLSRQQPAQPRRRQDQRHATRHATRKMAFADEGDHALVGAGIGVLVQPAMQSR